MANQDQRVNQLLDRTNSLIAKQNESSREIKAIRNELRSLKKMSLK